jgi:adenylate cyclase
MENPTPTSTSPDLTILFADISGSSLMYATRGDAVAFNLTSTCLNLMEEHVGQHGGRVVKRVGDGVMAVFESPEAALRAAEAIQRAVDTPDSLLRRERIQVRVGISCGPAVLDGDDVYGDVVNVAARLVSHAGSDEIFLSSHAYERLPADLRSSIRLIDQVVLRGRPSLVLVYQYMWKQEDVTVAVGVRTRVPTGTLEATYESQLLVIGPERPKMRIGRAPDNDITIDHDFVSRYHAEISLRGDKFFLTDSSTNGTYLQIGDNDILRISREDVNLSGRGRILAGSESAPAIRYQIIVKS